MNESRYLSTAISMFIALSGEMGQRTSTLGNENMSKEKMLAEYELIKQKKSKLPANKRKTIVNYVEKYLTKE